jgi:hypothetical protein
LSHGLLLAIGACRLSANFVNRPDLKLARFGTGKRDGRLSVNDIHHLVVSAKGRSISRNGLRWGHFLIPSI